MDPATLSPRELLAHLRLDDEVVGGYVLSDCYRVAESEPVRLELRRGSARVEVEVAPTPEQPRHRPMASVAGLDIGYRSPAPPELGEAACKRVAEQLRASLGDAPRRWTVAAPSLRELAEPVAAEIVCEDAELEADPDHALLRHDFAAYERLYGARPRAVSVSVAGERVPGISVHYPSPLNGRLPPSASLYSTSLRVSHRRRMRRYFASIGYVFGDDAILRTVPTPTTYASALSARRDIARIRPRMIAGISSSLRPIHWGVLVRRNLLPVSVAPDRSVSVHQRIRDIGPLAQIPCDIGMLPHDMGLHAAGLHAIPSAAWDELVALAMGCMRKRPLSVLAGPWGLLARLAEFFEGSLSTHTWKTWAEAEEPEDFAEAFKPHFRELSDELRSL